MEDAPPDLEVHLLGDLDGGVSLVVGEEEDALVGVEVEALDEEGRADARQHDVAVSRLGHAVNDELCVKKLHIEDGGGIWLLSENEAYPPIRITEEMDFEVWGRVMHSIQQH